MKRATFALLAAMSAATAASSPAMAASDEECANWLCLPAGYPGGANCEGPHDAMIERLRDGKSPLPDYGSCASENSLPEYRMTARDGIATRYQGAYHQGEYCMRRKDEWIPNGCRGRNYWYVEVYNSSGEQLGETQYIPR